jgi:hypothetical protein
MSGMEPSRSQPDATWHELTARAVGLARDAGALAVLPIALIYRSGVHVHEGEFAAAAGLIEEADAITVATGNASLGYISMMLAAWRGEETRTLELIEAVVRNATAIGEGRALGLAWHATAVLCNGLGGYEAALAAHCGPASTRTWLSSDVPGRARRGGSAERCRRGGFHGTHLQSFGPRSGRRVKKQ